jgi:REP element-mobilizing transposase RayT
MEESPSQLSPFAGGHHARMFDGRTPMHIISRVYQGRFLLRPDDELNDLILGVVGRGQVIYPEVKLHVLSVMSNHMHAIATGPATQLPFFIGFIKREISRRWGMRPDVDWPGVMWEPYVATALPTHESQVNALKYVLSQGVKEDLVERPQDWPGVNCVHALLLGRKMSGQWLDATKYKRAIRLAARSKKPKKQIKRADYLVNYNVELSPLPAFEGLSTEASRKAIADILDELRKETITRRAADGSTPVGVRAVKTISRETRVSLPPPPWFEERRRMIVWANLAAPETRAYIRDYWAFQFEFREASLKYRSGNASVEFPPGSFRPSLIVHALS